MRGNYETFLSFLPPELRNRQVRPYYIPLTTPAAGLGGAATVQLTTPLQNVAAYLLCAIVGRVYTGAAPQVSIADPGITVEGRFSAGDDLTFGAVPWSCLIDSGGNASESPGGLVIPRLVPGGSNIALTLVNYTAVAYNVRLGLVGVNVYSS